MLMILKNDWLKWIYIVNQPANHQYCDETSDSANLYISYSGRLSQR